jgi:hypothetical protein
MVFIDLDNIILYHQPPFNPSRSHPPISAGPYQSSRTTPPLTHPLPPRPPQTPSMAVHTRSPDIVNPHPAPDLGLDKPATLMHRNAFDKELAKFDLVETVDITADGTDIDASQQRDGGCGDDTERQPLEIIWPGKSISHHHSYRHSWSISPDRQKTR